MSSQLARSDLTMRLSPQDDAIIEIWGAGSVVVCNSPTTIGDTASTSLIATIRSPLSRPRSTFYPLPAHGE